MAGATLSNDMLCDNKECQHALKHHIGERDKGKTPTIEDLKSFGYPCLYFDRDSGTFAVCACRDFELPAIGTEGQAAVTPDEPVHQIRVPGQPLELLLWVSGRVTWQPLT